MFCLVLCVDHYISRVELGNYRTLTQGWALRTNTWVRYLVYLSVISTKGREVCL